LTRDAVLVGDDAWRCWLRAPETTAFRFEDEGAAFTARRELRRGHAYWYAYRRRGPKLEKVYLGRPEEIDLDRLRAAAAKLSATAAPSSAANAVASPSGESDARYSSRFPTPATRLIGRESEVAAARARLLLPEVRLLTFTGPGGTGKTRLAIEVAASLAVTFADGVHFVDLSPIRDPTLVHAAIAHALGIRDAGDQPLLETLRLYLQPRHHLLVLDNCEQVIAAAAALVADLLAAAPALKIATTSREPLRLSWEHEWPVAPLDLPPASAAADRAVIAASPAVALFVERARAAKPDFALTGESARIVAEICGRLDGLPLAIELTAAWVKLLPLAAIHARLVQSLTLLTDGPRDAPERQRTMRAAIAWSYDLLDREEQATFRRLAIFEGGFTLDAAGVIYGTVSVEDLASSAASRPPLTESTPTGSSFLARLRSLLAKNLIRSDPSSATSTAEPRFRLLETIREFGLEQLAASGELDVVQERHARYFLALARSEDEPWLFWERADVKWLDQLEADHDNLRAALQWSLAAPDRAELGARLVSALALFWTIRGHFDSGRAWLDRVLARTEVSAVASSLRVNMLRAIALIARQQGDYVAAARFCDEGIALGRGCTSSNDLAQCLILRGSVATLQAQYDLAHASLDQGLRLAREVGSEAAYALTLAYLAMLGCFEGEHERARSLGGESLRLFRRQQNQWAVALNLDTLGTVARRQGQYDRARSFHEESLAASQSIGFKSGIALALACLGHVARVLGDAAARTHYAASLRVYRESGDRRGVALTLGNLAVIAEREGKHHEARECLAESLTTARLVGDKRILAAGLNQQVRSALAAKDLPVAVASCVESLQLSVKLQDRRGIARALAGCADVLAAAGRREAALELRGRAEALLDALGVRRSPTEQASHAWPRSRIRADQESHDAAALVDPSAVVAARMGRSNLTMEQAIDEMLATARRSVSGEKPKSAPPAPAPSLTPRGAEVAALIARGWSNRQIAERLVISQRTADAHVAHILAKLGFAARSQIAVWATGPRSVGDVGISTDARLHA
jgi:predicted ATPase/DNA-binding CsgD family transcriptional regulator